MSDLRTIPAALENAANVRPDSGFTFLNEDKTENVFTFPDLLSRAKAIAAALQRHGMRKGDRVALILPQAEEFVPTFLGVAQGGGVPVPLYPPLGLGQLGHYLEHCRHIVSASRATLLVTNSQIKTVIGTVRESAPDLRALLTFKDLDGDEKQFQPPSVSLDDLAFIQFTSGSTSRPKGVMLTHGNLAVNCSAIMNQGLEYDAKDRGISWLPLFHDMGLIGFVIAPMMHPTPVTFMPPMMFLKRPAVWLQTISKHRGTITYAPNFAYALAVKRVRDEDIEGIDLSCIRVAGCGAEPIQAETLRAFADRFAKYGFKESMYVPSYGMAESSLAIAFARGIPLDRVKSAALWEQGHAEPAVAGDPGAIEVVGCGKRFVDHEIKIVDVESGAEHPERRVGEIVIKGPSVTAGYFDDAEKTRDVIRDGWLRTGDLGYLADGQIFICGRQKDVIIINGKNYYPQDLEWVAGKLDAVRAGNVVAFASHKAGLDREAVVVVAESRADGEGRDKLAVDIRNEIQRTVGLVVDEVVVAKPGTIPKTSSGKLQRSKARALYESGELKPRVDAGAIETAKHVVQSQLAHLKLSNFAGGKK